MCKIRRAKVSTPIQFFANPVNFSHCKLAVSPRATTALVTDSILHSNSDLIFSQSAVQSLSNQTRGNQAANENRAACFSMPSPALCRPNV